MAILNQNMKIDKPYKIFAEGIEKSALDQFERAMQQPFAIRGALMPDAHVGYSLPIGAVVATDGVVLPSWVGYDIGCGMCALPTTFSAESIRKISQTIFADVYRAIPVGFNHNPRNTPWEDEPQHPRSGVLQSIFEKNGLLQLGSLGGGNHFIEIGAIAETGQVWIIIHSGSRGIGHAVATHYMRLASGGGRAREGHFALDVETKDGKNYIKDMNFCLAFALRNRLEMMRRVVNVLKMRTEGTVDWDQLINRNHNHADLKDGMWIHRKGATHAEAGMMGVIPGNMRDGSFIVRGKGNPDSLWSSSHGAGRVLGRKEAKRTLDMKRFANTMKRVTAKVTEETLDESPFAYKNIFTVMEQQSELVETVAHVVPIINIKA